MINTPPPPPPHAGSSTSTTNHPSSTISSSSIPQPPRSSPPHSPATKPANATNATNATSPATTSSSLPPSSSPSQSQLSTLPCCLNCSQRYDDAISSAYPRLLHCLHTYCTSCCQTIAHNDTGKIIICPLCSYETKLTDDGILSLSTNFGLLRQIKTWKKSQLMNEVFICNNCDTEIATWRCQNCEDGYSNLCNECKIQHLQMKALRSHSLITMDEFKSSNSHSRDLFVCHKHANEYLEVYCVDCQLAICLTCAVYEHNSHQRKTIDDGLLIEQHLIQQDITDIYDVYNIYERETDSIDAISINLTKQNEGLKTNITNLFHDLYKLLQEREQTLLNELDDMYQLKSSLLNQQIQGIREDISNARLSANYAETILEHASPLQTILSSQQIHKHSKYLSTRHLDTIPHSQADLIFESGTLPNIKNLINGIGKLFDESTPIPSLCSLSQVSVSIAPNHYWLTTYHLIMKQSNGDLLTHPGGIKPVVSVKMYDIQNPIQNNNNNNNNNNGNKKNKEEVYENIPFTISFQNGLWKIEVLSSKISGIVIEASVNGEDVQFSPLMATRGPEITLWGENAGTILRSAASHLGNLTSTYGPENLRTSSGSLKWKTSKTQNIENLDESVELGLLASHCLIGHINLINRKAEYYRLYYRPAPLTRDEDLESQPWLPLHILSPTNSSSPEWSEIHADAKWTIRLTEEECRELGPVSALRLELKSSLAGSSFCMINVFGWNISQL